MQPHFTKEDLRQMTTRQLRLIDINSVDDEKIIQEVLNERLEADPGKIKVKTSDVPDITTPEQEAEWQAKLDARKQAKKERIQSSVNTSEGSEEADAIAKLSDNKDTNVGDEDASESTEDDENFIDHVVTQEDLDENPDLVAEGVKVGETIQLPKTVEKFTEVELSKMKTAQLVEAATSIGLEFDPKTVTNNPQRVKAILEFQSKE